ncbi:MAG: class I SAM-dependent methyltransferase [Bacillaceae bacterium]|nr:class I SAM-dependent methyltransferase [Bacillaceae bacterium]
MSVATWMCKKLNRWFPRPVHPFNLANEGKKTYAEWQFERGEQTLQFYLRFTSKEDMFTGKEVLDIGCGAGGKTLYYATLNPRHVYGIDVVEHYREEATELARKKGLDKVSTFVTGDAANLSFPDDKFDTIIMNDAMEHVDDPIAVLNECHRVLKPGGRLYVNFPPYYHPYGAHLSDVIGIPWVHSFFSEKTLIQVYKDLVSSLPDGEKRIEFRIGRKDSGEEYFSYINKMTIKRFEQIKKSVPLRVRFEHHEPLRPFLSVPARLPLSREYFVKMVVCIFEKA